MIIDIKAIHLILMLCVAVLSAQSFKFILYFIKNKKPNYKMFFEGGKMPSSHTAFCFTLVFFILFIYGITLEFVIALVYCGVVVRDAIHHRLSLKKDQSKKYTTYEVYRHKISEVFGGFVLGLIINLIYYFIFFDM